MTVLFGTLGWRPQSLVPTIRSTENLERVDLHQTLGQRILKIGTIVVDTGDDVLNIDMVRHPAKVQELLSARLGRRAWTGQQPPPTR